MKYEKIIICFVSIFFVLSCVISKQYVGSPVEHYNYERWCLATFFPKGCEVDTEHFIFNLWIEKTGNPNEYYVKGTAKFKEAGGALRIEHEKSVITLILAKDYIVSDQQSFSFIASELGEVIEFDKKFVTTEFDAYTFVYKIAWVS